MRRIARFHDLKDVIAGDRTRLSPARDGDFRWKISAVRISHRPLMFQIAFGLNAFRSGVYLLALFGGDLI
jgi:hypothetical protein